MKKKKGKKYNRIIKQKLKKKIKKRIIFFQL